MKKYMLSVPGESDFLTVSLPDQLVDTYESYYFTLTQASFPVFLGSMQKSRKKLLHTLLQEKDPKNAEPIAQLLCAELEESIATAVATTDSKQKECCIFRRKSS